MNDTSLIAHKKQLEIIMSKTPQERFIMGIDMMNDVRKMVENSIRLQYPDISPIELQVAIFKRYYRKDFSPELLERICQSMRRFWLQHHQAIIAKGGDGSYFGDAAEWQRQERQDRN